MSAWLLICLLFLSPHLSRAADTDTAFDAANKLLAQGKAAEAARAYGQLATEGRTSPALERNWAQADFQSGRPGSAMSRLRRAARLAPRDEDIRADLALLRTKVGSGTAADDDALGALRFLKLDEWAWLALVAVWSWSAMLIASRLNAGARAALRGFTLGAGIVACVLAVTLAAATRRQAREPDAVVLAADTPVRQSPLEEAKVAFVVPAAAELRVRDAKDGWLMVEDPASQRFGWLKQAQVARVSL